MADPVNIPNDESKKDTVRINLPPSMTRKAASPLPKASPPSEQTKRDTAPIGSDQAKKETGVMGMPPSVTEVQAKNMTMLMGSPVSPSEVKKETARVAVPSLKPAVPEMPRPTVRLRRETSPSLTTPAVPAAAPTGTVQVVPSTKPPIPEMPRPTVKLKVEEPAATTAAPAAVAPVAVSTSAAAEPVSMLDIGLTLGAAVISVVAVAYLAVVTVN